MADERRETDPRASLRLSFGSRVSFTHLSPPEAGRSARASPSLLPPAGIER